MYIYNVTINIDTQIKEDWISWMKETHIPDMLATGKFTHARLCRVIGGEESGGFTYAVQYTTKDQETLQQYFKEDASRLREDGAKKFPEKFVAFRTELLVVDEQGNL